MQIFAYCKDKLNKLNEVSIGVESKQELYELKEFIEYCITKIESNQFDHEHLSDYLMTNNHLGSEVDIVITKLK